MEKKMEKELQGENGITIFEAKIVAFKAMLDINVDMLPAMVKDLHDHKKQLAQIVSRDPQKGGVLRELLNIMRAAAKDTNRENYYIRKIEEIEACIKQCDTGVMKMKIDAPNTHKTQILQKGMAEYGDFMLEINQCKTNKEFALIYVRYNKRDVLKDYGLNVKEYCKLFTPKDKKGAHGWSYESIKTLIHNFNCEEKGKA